MLELKEYMSKRRKKFGEERSVLIEHVYSPVDKWIDRVVYYYRRCEESEKGFNGVITHEEYLECLYRVVKCASLSSIVLAQTHIDEGEQGDPWFNNKKGSE